MAELLRIINTHPLVTLIEAVITNNKVKHYKISLETDDFALISYLESLWAFSNIKIAKNRISAEYIVRPNEINQFYLRVKNLSTQKVLLTAQAN